VCCDDHGICVWEGYEFDIGLGEGQRHARAFGLHNWAFDRHVIDLAIVLSFLSFVLEIQVGASSDCMDGSEGWEVGAWL
jgi:hypothetical protein